MHTAAQGTTRTGIYRAIQPPPLAIVVAASATRAAEGTAIAMAAAATAGNW